MFTLGGESSARLSRADTGESVVFDYNPATIVISHSAPMTPTTARGPGNKENPNSNQHFVVNYDQLPNAMDITTIAIRELTFVGSQSVGTNCTLLHYWSNFKNADKSTKTTDLPKLKFSWGTLNYPVSLNQVTIRYTRFSRTGTPVRAVVDLSLHLIRKPLSPTNPSSGGLSGRRTHLLTGAETLPELATRTYGGPDHWREIAAANGIQDPLRVRPGTFIYLPSAEEGGR